MIELPKTMDVKKFFVLILVFLIATDFATLLDITFLRQIIGFLFLISAGYSPELING